MQDDPLARLARSRGYGQEEDEQGVSRDPLAALARSRGYEPGPVTVEAAPQAAPQPGLLSRTGSALKGAWDAMVSPELSPTIVSAQESVRASRGGHPSNPSIQAGTPMDLSNPFMAGAAGLEATMVRGATEAAAAVLPNELAGQVRGFGQGIQDQRNQQLAAGARARQAPMPFRGPAGMPNVIDEMFTRPDGKLDKFAQVAGSSLPLMLAPLAGPMGMVPLAAAGMGEVATEMDEQGVPLDDGRRRFATPAGGAAYAAVERLGGPGSRLLTKTLPSQVTRQAGRNLLTRAATQGAAEELEEALQQGVGEVAARAAGGRGSSLQELIDERKEEFGYAAVLGGGTSVVGDVATGNLGRTEDPRYQERQRQERAPEGELSRDLDALVRMKQEDPAAFKALQEEARAFGAGEVDRDGQPTGRTATDPLPPRVRRPEEKTREELEEDARMRPSSWEPRGTLRGPITREGESPQVRKARAQVEQSQRREAAVEPEAIEDRPAVRGVPLEYRAAEGSDRHMNIGGGRMEAMSPDAFLSQLEPLEIDEAARENIEELKGKIRSGQELDPPVIYDRPGPGGSRGDGRHRAVAARELGIESIPVQDLRSQEAPADAPAPAWAQRRIERATRPGKEQSSIFPGDNRKVQTAYRVVEADELRASHTPSYAQRDETEFPPEIQGRAYHGNRGRQAREFTEQIVNRFDSERSLDPTLSVGEGPPVVTGSGVAVAGNGRIIAHQRLYESQPERAQELRDRLRERAAEFGLDPQELEGIRNPVLVREIVDPNVNQADVTTLRELNQSSDQPVGKTKDVLSDAASRAEQFRAAEGSLRHFSETADPQETIRSYLGGSSGRDFLRKLVEDGVISDGERARFVDAVTGVATDEGKQMVERMFYSAAVGDADVISRAPSSALRKLDTALPAIIRANAVEGWSIEEELRGALDLMASARANDMTVEDFEAQRGMFDQGPDATVVELAKALESKSKKDLVEKFRSYAAEAEAAQRQGQSDDLFGYEPRSADEARGDIAALSPAMDLFGNEVEPGVRQEELLGSGGPQGVTEAYNDARAIVSQLQAKVEAGAATDAEKQRYATSLSFVRRQEGRGLDATEVADRARQAKQRLFASEPTDNGDLFGQAQTDPTHPGTWAPGTVVRIETSGRKPGWTGDEGEVVGMADPNTVIVRSTGTKGTRLVPAEKVFRATEVRGGEVLEPRSWERSSWDVPKTRAAGTSDLRPLMGPDFTSDFMPAEAAEIASVEESGQAVFAAPSTIENARQRMLVYQDKVKAGTATAAERADFDDATRFLEAETKKVEERLARANTDEEFLSAIKSHPLVQRDDEISVQPGSGKDTWAKYGFGGRVTLDKDTGNYRTDESAPEPDPQRLELHDRALETIASQRGFANAKDVPRGKIKMERVAVFVFGPPAAGKSSVAEPMAKQVGAILVDSDEFKKMLEPEFQGGSGAGEVHEESAYLSWQFLNDVAQTGANVVIPGTGKTLENALRDIEDLRGQGYKIHMVINELGPRKAATRAFRRHIKQGRYVSYDMILNVGDKPSQTFDALKERDDLIESYWRYDNDVPLGEKPRLVESGGRNPDARFDIRGLGRGDGAREGRGPESLSGAEEAFGGRGAARNGETDLRPLTPLQEAQSATLPAAGEFQMDEREGDAPAPSKIIESLVGALDDALQGFKYTEGRVPTVQVGKERLKPLGAFNTRTQVTRTTNLTDLRIFGHEAGHAMHQVLFQGARPERITDASLAGLPGSVRGELEDLGRGISDGSITEGFAEFWRRYLDNPDALADEAPNALDYMEQRLDAVPGLAEAWRMARDDWKLHRSSSPQARVRSHISTKNDPERMAIRDRWSRFRYEMLDDFQPFKELVEAIRERGNDVTTAEDVELMARLTRGSSGQAEHFLEIGALDYATLGKKGSSLREVLEPVKEQLDDFRDYLVARRVQELDDRGISSGIRRADADWTVDKLESRFGGTFQAAAEGLQAYQDSLLDYLVDSGVVSRESAERMRELNQSYVPFYRVMDGSSGGGKLGLGFGHLFDPIKKIKGSGRDIVDPIESIIKNTYAYTHLVAKQQVSNALADLADKPGVGDLLEGMVVPMSPTSFEVGEIVDQLDKSLPGFKETLEGLEAEGVDVTGDLLTIFRPGSMVGRKNTISVLRDGKRKFYEVDPQLYAALEGMDREVLPMWARWMSNFSSSLRAGATLAPEFQIRNPLRDQVMAFVQSEYGYVPFVDMGKGMFELLRKGEAYRQWIAAGGERAALLSLDRKSMQNKMRELAKSGGVKNVLRTPLDMLRAFSALMEDSTRMGEFMNARAVEGTSKEGLQRSASAAREISIDFARHGAKMTAIRAITAFWNARLQGYDRLGRAAAKDPVRFGAKVFAAITLPSLLEYAVNRDDEEYWDHPQWQRDLFWMFKIRDEWVRIPKPFELGLVFGTLPVRILDSFAGGRGGSAELDKFFEETLLREVTSIAPMPTMVQPLLENQVNYSFFSRRPIVPRSEENVDDRFHGDDYNSDLARSLAKWGPGDGWSARRIDNLLYSWTGGLGRLGAETVDRIIEDPSEPERPARGLSGVPGIRGVIARQPGFSSEPVERFYELFNKATTAKRTLSFLESEQRNEEALEIRNDPDQQRLRSMEPELREVQSQIAELRARREAINRDPDLSGQEKADRIQALGDRAIAITRRALERYGNREEE